MTTQKVGEHDIIISLKQLQQSCHASRVSLQITRRLTLPQKRLEFRLLELEGKYRLDKDLRLMHNKGGAAHLPGYNIRIALLVRLREKGVQFVRKGSLYRLVAVAVIVALHVPLGCHGFEWDRTNNVELELEKRGYREGVDYEY